MNTAHIVLRPINSEYSRYRGNYRELRLLIDARAGEELDDNGRILQKGEDFLSCSIRSISQQTRHGPDPEWSEGVLQPVRVDAPPDVEMGYGKADTLDLAEAREIVDKLSTIDTWTHGMTSMAAALEGLMAYVKPDRIFYSGPSSHHRELALGKILTDVRGYERQVQPAQGAVQRVFDLMVGVA